MPDAPPEVVTLVIHHPARPLRCLERALCSLEAATALPHLVDLRVQGEPSDGLLTMLQDHPIATPSFYLRHVGPVLPRIDSILYLLGRTSAPWWAKLDDDADLPEGAWDHLIQYLEADEDAGWTMANPEGTRVPQNLVQVGGVLTLEEAPFTRCDFVGDGASVFRRELFEDGAQWDEAMLRGADLDLAMQAKALGYHCLLKSYPQSGHYHKECSPVEYDRVRYDAETVWQAAAHFRRKWNLDCLHLSQFGRRGSLQ